MELMWKYQIVLNVFWGYFPPDAFLDVRGLVGFSSPINCYLQRIFLMGHHNNMQSCFNFNTQGILKSTFCHMETDVSPFKHCQKQFDPFIIMFQLPAFLSLSLSLHSPLIFFSILFCSSLRFSLSCQLFISSYFTVLFIFSIPPFKKSSVKGLDCQ